MEQLLEKIIKVSSVTNLNPEDKKPINFKDENGDKYILWKTNKNGISVAYENFSKLPYGGDGATIGIAYVEEPKTFTNEQGKEIAFTQRTVRVVKEPSEVKPQNQVHNYQKVETPRPTPNNAPRPSQSLTKETDWDKIAEGKVRNSVAVSFIGQGKKFEPLVVREMNKWVGWIMTGNIFNKEPMNVPVTDEEFFNNTIEYPPMPEEDDIDVKNIPFG